MTMVEYAEFLRRALGDTPIVDVHAEDGGGMNSSVLRLRVTTEDGSESFILKRPTADQWSQEAALDEAAFYALVDTLPAHPPVVPRCLARDAGDNPFVLLEDLGGTHAPPLSRSEIVDGSNPVPPQPQLDQVVRTIGRLHGFWWDHDALDQVYPPYWIGEGFAHYAQRRSRSWQGLLDRYGDAIPARARELYPQVLAGLDGHFRDFLEPRVASGLTVIHGDCYFSNFLCPRAGGPAVLVDWQSASRGVGAGDLVNLCATFWTRAERAEWERHVLQTYHAELRAAGVTDYSMADLEQDYRLGLMYWLLMPVQDGFDGSPPD
ncbi:MAG TPA: aminoglycoside phosphotransferase family protein, partial [Mycobacteriales bacterium]|nr:aminoglycoside phosphotransferase family protein [Mycobacteriales bacterium]